jgi:hypothetical protein
VIKAACGRVPDLGRSSPCRPTDPRHCARPCGPCSVACGVPKLDAQLLTRCFLAELGGSSVFVDQSAEDLVASDRGAERDHGGGVVGWWVLAQALVRAVVIDMAYVLVENGAGVSFVVDQQPVGALGADAADEPLCVAVRPGRTGRDLDHGDAFGGEDGVESGGELGVPIADQEAEGADLITEVHQQSAGGLGGPGRGRVSGGPKDVHRAGADLHDEQDVDSAQRDGVEGEEDRWPAVRWPERAGCSAIRCRPGVVLG